MSAQAKGKSAVLALDATAGNCFDDEGLAVLGDINLSPERPQTASGGTTDTPQQTVKLPALPARPNTGGTSGVK